MSAWKGRDKECILFHQPEAEGTQHSHDPCLCLYSHDSSQQGENYAKGMCACLDQAPHSSSLFMVKSYVWGKERQWAETDCGSDLDWATKTRSRNTPMSLGCVMALTHISECLQFLLCVSHASVAFWPIDHVKVATEPVGFSFHI